MEFANFVRQNPSHPRARMADATINASLQAPPSMTLCCNENVWHPGLTQAVKITRPAPI